MISKLLGTIWGIRAIKIILIATGSVGLSYGLRFMLSPEDIPISSAHLPNHYMENFTTLTMDEQGLPKDRLSADYMAHYSQTNITELDKPQLELFRQNQPPVIIKADKGKRNPGTPIIQLDKNVYIYQANEYGEPEFELITQNVQFLPEHEFAKTDAPATFIKDQLTINSIGMRVYLQNQSVEFLHNVHTIIKR